MKRWHIGIIVILLLVGTIGPVSAHHREGHTRGNSSGPVAGAALYPDLITLRPSNLYFDQVTMSDGLAHYVLRFDNTVANVGNGRVELEGKKRSKVYQNIYDAATGGNLAQQIYIGNDSIFHEGHNHYHIENFASYLLLKDGQATTKKGTKTSSCVMDIVRVQGSYNAQYTTCGREVQGLTVGWGDTYGAHLADQWIDLGTTPLADGNYTVQSTADPRNILVESDDNNNTAWTCFTVQSRTITIISC